MSDVDRVWRCRAKGGSEGVFPTWPARRIRAFAWGAAALLTGLGCSKGPPPGPASTDGSPGAVASAASPSASPSAPSGSVDIKRAEDRRRAADVPKEARTSADVHARRDAARALARIADPSAADALVDRLADEDDEVVTWAAYGLGASCKGRDEGHVRALAARVVSLRGRAAPPAGPLFGPLVAIARAVGRCGGSFAEELLVAWARGRGNEADKELARAAVLGLGDLASKKKELGEPAQTALLVAAEDGTSDMAFYGLSRVPVAEMLKPRLLAAARAAAGKPGDARIFAVRALGRAGKDAAADLSAIVSSTDAGPAERAEAARTLGTLGEPGHAAAAELLGKLVPDKDPFAIAALGGSSYAVLATLLGALGDAAPKRAEPALNALANLEAPGEPPPPLARRIQDLRCLAAGHLARGAFDAEILKKCAPVGSYAAERARLAALVRQPLAGARKAEWRRLTKSEHVRVREAALEAADGHHELGAEARAAIAEALASDKAGLVATAADALNAHPERVLVLAESEKRAALDPKAPPPGPDPARELDRDVAKALRVALERKWAPDLFETRLALLDASVAVAHPAARAQALALCKDPNVTVRERAHKALRSLGDTQSTCHAPDDAGPAAEEVGKPSKPAKIVLSTDSGALTVKLAPELAPVTAARLASLAKAGFYKGIVVHRVVPGFVVQLGDPQGDGYGGSGTPLRCETSPSAFAPLDVGMALAGRDTGSSQFFVTLARTAHLDGEYTKVGHAEGDWASVVEGDVVRDVRVEE